MTDEHNEFMKRTLFNIDWKTAFVTTPRQDKLLRSIKRTLKKLTHYSWTATSKPLLSCISGKKMYDGDS